MVRIFIVTFFCFLFFCYNSNPTQQNQNKQTTHQWTLRQSYRYKYVPVHDESDAELAEDSEANERVTKAHSLHKPLFQTLNLIWLKSTRLDDLCVSYLYCRLCWKPEPKRRNLDARHLVFRESTSACWVQLARKFVPLKAS